MYVAELGQLEPAKGTSIWGSIANVVTQAAGYLTAKEQAETAKYTAAMVKAAAPAGAAASAAKADNTMLIAVAGGLALAYFLFMR